MRGGLPDERALAQRGLVAEEPVATPFQRWFALVTGVLLLAVTIAALVFGRSVGPQIEPLLSLAMGVWSLADLLTAFLLLAQFYVNGRRYLGTLSIAYALTGVIAWPYLATFPDMFPALAPSIGNAQIAIYLWSIWHALYPILITWATLDDTILGRFVSRRAIRVATATFFVAPLVVVAALTSVLYAYRGVLTPLVVHHRFVPIFQTIFIPTALVLNGIAFVALVRSKPLTSLRVALALAVFSAGLDATLNLCSVGYSYAWDTGRLITVFTASVVLLMMLFDIARLYGRLARIANTDVLTTLHNRRAFEEHAKLAIHNARRLRCGIGMLVIDIDFFKHFNDTYGHAGGDKCLRVVANALAGCVMRPLDLVARYGGEEFVIVLPDTQLDGVLTLAERIRAIVDELEIAQDGGTFARVTVSVGVGYAPDADLFDEKTLFERADRALYDAKRRGRNCVVLASNLDEPDRSDESTSIARHEIATLAAGEGYAGRS